MSATAGVIVCGGASSRLGSPKAHARMHDGRTALQHVAAAMRHAGLSPVLAVTGTQGPPLETLSGDVDTALLDHGRDGRHGPLWAVDRALEHAQAPCVMWPVDMPLVMPAVLRLLRDAPGLCALPGAPLCARVPEALRGAVKTALQAGHGGMRGFLRALGANTVRGGQLQRVDPVETWRHSFNTKEELEEMNARARECAMRAGAS